MKKIRQYLKNKRGFTLIEVVVVVALLGILMAIIVPSFEKAGERTKNSKLTADLKALDTAIGLHKLDKGAVPDALADLEPEYINAGSEFKDAKNTALVYTPGTDKQNYQLKGKNTKDEDVFSASSTQTTKGS